MAINLLGPGGSSSTAYLIADSIPTIPAGGGLPAGNQDGTATLTRGANGQPVSAALEIQSTLGGLLIPRMTTTQLTALNVVDGFMVYNLSANSFYLRQGGAWQPVSVGTGNGDVVGPDASTVNAIAVYGNTLGTAIANTNTLLDPTEGNFTGVGTIAAADGTLIAPTYAFTSGVNTGMWSSAAHTIDFSGNGTRQLQIGHAAGAVNYIQILGGDNGNPPGLIAKGSDTNVDLAVLAQGSGAFAIFANTSGGSGALKLYNGADTFYSIIQAGNNTANHTWTWPTADGTNGQGLVTNGSGVLSFAAVGNVFVTPTPGANIVPSFVGGGENVQTTPVSIAQTSGNITGAGFIHATKNVAAALNVPTYSFTGDTVTGMGSTAANTIDFSTNSVRQVQIGNVGSAVNYILLEGGAALSAPRVAAQGSDAAVALNLLYKGAASVNIFDSTAVNGATISLFNAAGNDSISLSVNAALGSTVDYTLPTAPGANGDLMACTTSGVMSWVTPASILAGQTLQYATGTISAAAFNGAYATPVQIVAAAGANTLLVPVQFGLELVYGTTQFTGGGVTYLQFGNTAHAAGTVCTAGQAASAFTGATANTIIGAKFQPTLPNALTTALVNTGLYLTNDTAAFATGDSTFNYYIAYMVVTTT